MVRCVARQYHLREPNVGTEYSERYCAYVDILGFSDLVASIRAGRMKFEAIRDLLHQVHAPRSSQVVGATHFDFQAQSISDALVLSTALSISGLAVLIDTLESLTINALYEGYLLRGAVCRGLLYHDQHTVFGEALITAYQLESRIVRYPRIMLTKQVVDDALASNLKHYLSDHIQRAEDGPFFIHFFRHLMDKVTLAKASSAPHTGIPEVLFRYAVIRDTIQKKFDDATDNPNHFDKIAWLANYWNVTFGKEAPENFKFIEGPGLREKRFFRF